MQLAPIKKNWWTSAALRPVIAVLLIVLMASNVVAGSFSGVIHSHENGHVSHHHHGDGDHHHHDSTVNVDAIEAWLADVDGRGAAGPTDDKLLGTLHDHGPIITLGLVGIAEWPHDLVRALWEPAHHAQFVPRDHSPSERPPRAA